MEIQNPSIDFNLCLVCQTEKEEPLVENLRSSYEKILQAINARAGYGETKYVKICSSLNNLDSKQLEGKKATWHRKCYQEVTHSGNLKRSKERYENELFGTEIKKRKIESQLTSPHITRSQTVPYNKEVCFFCDKPAGYRETLYCVRTESAGKSLHDAVAISGDDKLRVKLSTAVDQKDAHSIDIKYHKRCWGNNVSTVLRKSSIAATPSPKNYVAAEIAAKIEFVATTEAALRNKSVMNMSDLQTLYEGILVENGVNNKTISRKAIKKLINNEINDIEFYQPKQRNESERVTIKETKDTAFQLSEDTTVKDDMKELYNTALRLRRSINNCKKWAFDGSLESVSKNNYPEELYCFFRWVINGPRTSLSSDKKCQEVHKRAMSLVQNTVSLCLTERQVCNRKSEMLRSSREMPQQVAVGIAVHQTVRSKQLVNMLRGLGMSIEYNRLLRIEAQIEASVLKRMEENNGLFLPADIVQGRHIFFAIDNVDFAEDTYDGRNTLHGTVMAIYQKCHEDDEKPQLSLESNDKGTARTVKDLPPSITTLLKCPEPFSKPSCPTYPRFCFFSEEEIPITQSCQDYAWLLARALSRVQHTGDRV